LFYRQAAAREKEAMMGDFRRAATAYQSKTSLAGREGGRKGGKEGGREGWKLDLL